MKTTISAFALVCGLASTSVQAEEQPRLVLQITVDQLRGDLPFSISPDRLTDGGFRWLLENGVVYRDAHHAHANTETIVGHATLATGAYPSVHGMVGNIWYDSVLGREVYNIEDPDFPLLSADADVNDETEIDPTQRAAGTDGRSPLAILSSTFSDELAAATGGQAKIFGVSVKDRGAISLAGHAGKAFWFSKSAGAFVTSSYYYDAYPEWVLDWNAAGHVASHADTSWTLSHDPATYTFGERDDQDWEVDFPGYGRVFPHAFGPGDGDYFTTLLTLSPVGDELTLDFAIDLIDAEEIGQDDITDYLSVSFSSTDYIGHFFGSASLEQEDNLLRLDKSIAALLAHVDATVGLDNTVVVLSADHGGPEAPGYLASVGAAANLVSVDDWRGSQDFEELQATLGVGPEIIVGYSHPYLNLDHDLIDAHQLDLAEVQAAVAEILASMPGVFAAVTSSQLALGNIPDSDVMRLVANNFNRDRSGDIYVVLDPGSYIADFDGLTVAVSHGQPWQYDTFVPLIFAGNGIVPTTTFRKVETVQLAPTLSALLGIRSPSGSWGEVLEEVVVHVGH